MNSSSRASIVVLLMALSLIVAAMTGLLAPGPADAHGSTQMPPSRTYSCRFGNTGNAMCEEAWSFNAQALYDWMEVNIGDADGRHQELIPDGQLCSAGRAKYAAFDRPGEWPVTGLEADGSGLVNLSYHNTAPHSTAYYRVYVTREGFDARTHSLRWADLELFHDSGPLDRSTQQQLQVALPTRSVPAVLYIVWQRSDSPEAFYACSDVTINAGSSPTPVPVPAPPAPGPAPSIPTVSTTAVPSTVVATTAAPSTTRPPAPGVTTSPAPPQDPATTMPGMPADDPDPMRPPRTAMVSTAVGIEAEKRVTASWDSGQCFTVKVTNTTSTAREWEVHLSPGGRVDALWNASSTRVGYGERVHLGPIGEDARLRLVGTSWNLSLGAKRWTSFGMCVGF